MLETCLQDLLLHVRRHDCAVSAHWTDMNCFVSKFENKLFGTRWEWATTHKLIVNSQSKTYFSSCCFEREDAGPASKG